MDKSARVRWTILLTMLSATVIAIVYPVEQPSAQAAAIVVVPARSKAPPPAAPAPAAAATRTAWEPLLEDPFAARTWEAPPVAAPVPVAVSPVVAEVVVAPPTAPPLPFQVVGQMNDSTDKVVYLARGEEALLARAGEVLAGTYKVLAITPAQIEFEHLPTGQRQALVFPAQTN